MTLNTTPLGSGQPIIHKSLNLTWSECHNRKWRGYLTTDPGTTLFIFRPHVTRDPEKSPQGTLTGAFIPDDAEDCALIPFSQACTEAEAHLLRWKQQTNVLRPVHTAQSFPADVIRGEDFEVETPVLTILWPDGPPTEMEYSDEGLPDFFAALVPIAQRYGLDEDDIDVGHDRDHSAGQRAVNIYHPQKGLLATITYYPTRY